MPQERRLPTRSTHSIPRFSSFNRIRAQFHSPHGPRQFKIFSGFTHIPLCLVEFVGKNCTSSNTTFLTTARGLSPFQAVQHARHTKKKRQDASCRSLNSPHCAVGVVAVAATGASVPGSSTVLIFTVARIFSSPLKTFSRSTCVVLSVSPDVPRPRANS
jgi:hypothetical protein